jgi:hypothetical protein
MTYNKCRSFFSYSFVVWTLHNMRVLYIKHLSVSVCVCVIFIVKVKSKVVPMLCFNCAPRHEGILGELRYSSTHSLNLPLGGGEWSASRPGRFTPRERAPTTHGIGGWMGPRAVLDAVVKRKIPSPRRESNPRTPIVQPVTQILKKYLSVV